ncbi:hypothetical protein ACH5Y9_05540 [Methylomonas sp. BW4-1]|uniref:hypothetical protein n=1 Tax=Methylomonas sp. BW4-1 TaxID=3376685 RepID=UPI0040436A95
MADEIGHIVIVGPVGIGKSLVLARIEQVLRDEFGAAVENLESDSRSYLTTPPQDWENEMVAKTTWVLSEHVQR